MPNVRFKKKDAAIVAKMKKRQLGHIDELSKQKKKVNKKLK